VLLVDEQSSFTAELLHNTPAVLTLIGEHEPTAAGDWAVLVPAAVGSCTAAPFYSTLAWGGELMPDLSVTVTLSAAVTGGYALCLAHQPFGSASPAEAEFDFHPHVTATLLGLAKVGRHPPETSHFHNPSSSSL